MDISDLHENIEDDYYISSFFPVEVQPLIIMYFIQTLLQGRFR